MKPYVLVVEDNADLRTSYMDALALDGVASVSAIHGRQALDLLENIKDLPRIVLLDMMMPVMDGWAFLEERSKDPRLFAIPVIVCSAVRSRALPNNTFFLRKPVELETLLEKIHDLFSAKNT